MILAINWDVSAELIEGWKTPNLYGLLFVTGLILGYFVVQRMFKKQGIPDSQLDKLVLYMVLATIIGARLGHVLFYGPYFDVYNEVGMRIEEGKQTPRLHGACRSQWIPLAIFPFPKDICRALRSVHRGKLAQL